MFISGNRKLAGILLAALVVGSCGGGSGTDETRNAVITPKTPWSPADGTHGHVTGLFVDPASAKVYGQTYTDTRIEEGLTVSGATVIDTQSPGNMEVPQSFPNIFGSTDSALPDGAGGWYVGGMLQDILGLSNRTLVRVRSDGSHDPAFDPPIDAKVPEFGSSERVMLLENHPTDPQLLVTVLKNVDKVGESLVPLADLSCGRLVLLDKKTGSVAKQLPLGPSCPSSVLLWNSQIIFSGSFQNVKGIPRNKIAGVDIATLRVTNVGEDFGNLLPHFSVNGKQQMVTRIARQGNTLYLFGRLNAAGQMAAAINLATGRLTGWKPSDQWPVELTDQRLRSFNMMVTGSEMVVMGCLTGIEAVDGRFVSYKTLNGLRTNWNPGIDWGPDECTGLNTIVMGDTVLVQGEFTAVNGVTVPNQAWFGANSSLMPNQIPLAVDYVRQSPPHAPVKGGRYFPAQNRVLLQFPFQSMVLGARDMGPYLAASSTGITEETALSGRVEGLRRVASYVAGGFVYVMQVPEGFSDSEAFWAESLAARRVVHRFSVVDGRRDESFEIDHTGLVSAKVVVGENHVAVVAWAPAADGRTTINFYSLRDGSQTGSYPAPGAEVLYPDGHYGATADGDTLYVTGWAPDVPGAAVEVVSAVTMPSGEARVLADTTSTDFSCVCDPTVIDGRLFVVVARDRAGGIVHELRAFDTGTGEDAGFAVPADRQLISPPMKFGNKLIVPVRTDESGLRVFDAGSLAPLPAFAADTQMWFTTAWTATADRVYAWFAVPHRRADGSVLTGLVAFDESGVATMSPAPVRPVVDNPVPLPVPVENPSVGILPVDAERAVANPAVVSLQDIIATGLAVQSGRIVISSVTSGNRSLTVRFDANGNSGPFDVREAGGKKLCTTSGDACTFSNLTAHSSYAFTVESRGRVNDSRSPVSQVAKPVVTMKRGKTLRLASVLKPASKTAVKWKASRSCVLNPAKGTLTAPKKASTCTVSVTSKARGKAAVTRSIRVVIS